MTAAGTISAVSEPVEHGEGPLWDDERSRLMWVDIPASTVHEFDPTTGRDMASQFDVPVTAIAPRQGGGYVFAAGMSFATCDWPSTSLSRLATVDRGDCMNDGACDPAGRLVAGTMVSDGSGAAALYQLDQGDARLLLDGVSISNGLDWSLDGQIMYYVDTPLERIDAFDYDLSTGALSARRTFVDLRDVPGRPDGLTVDAEGCVWVAMARGGAAVRKYTSEGERDLVVSLPVPNVTSLAFGGDGLSDLYVTTSRLALGTADRRRWPLAGALFRVADLDVRGRRPNKYRP